MPAAPNTFTLQPVSENGAVIGYDRRPVIAWGLPEEGFPAAITVEGHDGEHAILLPDGTVVRPFVDTYADLESFIDGQKPESQKVSRRPAVY